MITRVTLEDWKSHKSSELSFTGGVNALVGEMGAGKTAVLEALTFGLYGKLPAVQERKIGLDDLIRRSPTKADQATVTVGFERDGTEYTVERTIERDKGTTESILRQDGDLIAGPQTREVTAKVEDLLGIEFDLFTRIAYSEQNQLDFFLELPPSERKEQIDQLLKLDRFEDARSNLVTLTNRVRDRYSDRKATLKDLRDEIDTDEKAALEDDIEDLRDDLEGLHDRIEDAQERREELEDDIEDLHEQQEQYDDLQEQQTRVEAQLENLQERKAELNDRTDLDMDAMNEDTVQDRIEEIQDELAEIEEIQDELDSIADEQDHLDERIERLEDEIEDLHEQTEKLEDLEDVQEQKEQLEAELDEAKEQRAELQAERDQAEETIQSLAEASDTCPACGQDLTEDHRITMLQESKQTREDVTEDLEAIEERIEGLQEQLEEIEEQEATLLSYRGAPEKLDEKQETLDDLREDRTELDERRDELKDNIDEERQDELEQQLDELEQADDYFETVAKIEERQKKLEDIGEKLEELSFDEDKLEEKQEALQSAEKTIEVASNKIEDREELLEEKEKRLDEITDQEERIEELEEQVERYDRARDFLNRFETQLERTQEEMRQQFIANANTVMQSIWSTVYPYDDYSSIRLEAGDDYILQLKDERAGWVPVEGEVSGGERHTAALVLRIALSKVLAPDLNLLILDEPTHNLDTRAIDDMATTLRNDVADLMDQLFIITHEEQLEAAVTGSLYNLQKNDTDRGVTQVEEATYE